MSINDVTFLAAADLHAPGSHCVHITRVPADSDPLGSLTCVDRHAAPFLCHYLYLMQEEACTFLAGILME